MKKHAEIEIWVRYPLKAVNVMHTVALRTESTLSGSITHPTLSTAVQVYIKGRSLDRISCPTFICLISCRYVMIF